MRLQPLLKLIAPRPGLKPLPGLWLCLVLAACSGGSDGGSGGGGSAALQVTAACGDGSACTDVQLGGAVTGASVTATLLQDTGTLVEQGRTPTLEEVRSQLGESQWDQLSDLEKLRRLGKFVNDIRLYADAELYLVRASGGLDQDADANNLLDTASAQVAAANATPVLGEWHAIVPGSRVGFAGITPLTEAIFRYLQSELATLSYAELLARLDTLAANTVADVDGSGNVDYNDLLAWDRHRSASFYLHDIDAVDELAAAVRGNATLSTLLQLSTTVLQAPDNSEQVYTLSGSIAVPPNHRVDRDVNNPAAPLIANDDFASAQAVEAPLVLGGYANIPNAGAVGRSQVAGDIDDYYQMSLKANDVVSLVMADSPETNDLDLYLYRADETLVDASMGVDGIEQITVPEDGDYLIHVEAFDGGGPPVATASNYQLSVGVTAQTLAGQSLKLSDDFVPGEIIARFRDRPRVNSIRGRAIFTGMRVRGGLRRANLLQMDAAAADSLQQRKLKTLRRLKRLRSRDEVSAATLNYRVQAAVTEPNDPRYFQQRWHYGLINLPAAWDNPRRGQGVVVAVIDSGIRSNHPDLQSKLEPGYDFFENDSNPLEPGGLLGSQRNSFHGSHVAGTIGAASNNSSGVAGVAWNARIMPLRVLGPDGGTSYDVLQAVRYAAGLENDSGRLPAQPADIINLSLAGGGFNSFEQSLYSQVSILGIMVVAAAGNDGSSGFAYPASYDGVISVGAVDINRQRTGYSNSGSAIDVVAPGGDGLDGILSTGADDSVTPVQEGYTILIGTSMATPHVAGVLALMKSIYPPLTASDVDELLARGLLTTDLGAAGRDNDYGWGLIDALKAVAVAEDLAGGGSISLEPTLCTNSSELNFGNFAVALPLSISNCGAGSLAVNLVEPSDPWVTISANAVNENGLGRYTVQIDRQQLPVGRRFSSIRIRGTDLGTGDELNSTVKIVVEQPEPGTLASGDAGVHYVLLLDALTFEVVQEVEVFAVDGRYEYTFEQVPAGLYQIVAGSDADNDFLICDPGEACGAWLALDSDQPDIEVNSDIELLDFTTSFYDGIVSSQKLDPADPKAARAPRRSAYRGPDGQR